MKTKFQNACTGFGLGLLISASSALGMGNASGKESSVGGGFQPGDLIGYLKNTYYKVPDEKDFAGEAKTARIRTLDGDVIARVSPRFKDEADIEGTGRLANGTVVNFAGMSGPFWARERRYSVTRNPWGDGYRKCPLHPFHTVAVDREQVPLGSIVKIVETENMLLPDGTRHNGLWRAEDTGSAITWNRVDLFIGLEKYETQMLTLTHQGIDHMDALTVKMVTLPGTDCRVSPGEFTPPSNPTLVQSLFHAPPSMPQL